MLPNVPSLSKIDRCSTPPKRESLLIVSL
jgi:hypothetical protein